MHNNIEYYFVVRHCAGAMVKVALLGLQQSDALSLEERNTQQELPSSVKSRRGERREEGRRGEQN